jgi:uncharacterized membrane protein YedE/YeeE
MRLFFASLSGALFGAGLLVSGMTDPRNVLAFLDVAGEWNPQLAWVMGGAVFAASPAFFIMRRRQRTLSGDVVTLPDRTAIDAPLIIGAAIFGVGWGLAGICPGPGIVLLVSRDPAAWIFMGCVAIGIWCARWWRR